MIDWTEITDGEAWESFARDFLVDLGFSVLAEPGRGADGGRDMLVSEVVSGSVSKISQKWLVSCKHFATSGNSVKPADEPSITDRVRQHGVDGFMGFYSTLPSNALVDRLRTIRADGGPSYYIWDGRSIEGSLLNRNQTSLMIRYLPQAFASIRPIAPLLGNQLKLPCEVCGKDALSASLDGSFNANVLMPRDDDQVTQRCVVCCKGECDRVLEASFDRRGWVTGWEDVTDLCNPLIYLRRMFALMNSVRARPDSIADTAYEEMKGIYTAVAQRTLRIPLAADEQRYRDLLPLEGL